MSGKSTKEKKEGFASPDPSFSSSTMPSYARFITPPLMIQDILEPPPSHSIPPPYPGQVKVRPHHYLEPNTVDWDIVDHPSLMSCNHHSISSRALDEPAFDMPLPYITITSPYLPWTIKVRASDGSCITLDDVYHSIYRGLRANITPNEFSMLKSESDRGRATRAYTRRYRRQRGDRAYKEEKRKGMKRIDFLMGYTHFLGISNNGGRPDEWQLVVS